MAQASQILLEEYQNIVRVVSLIFRKKDDSPVTQADLKVNRFIFKAVSGIYTRVTSVVRGE